MRTQRQRTMIVLAGAAVLAAALPASALQLSLGVRETGEGGGAEGPIGSNGGTAGGIEWINLDGQNLSMDNQWHQYSWDLDADPISAFAGSTANSILEGAYGTIEHIRVLNDDGVATPITMWVDFVVNTITTGPVDVQSFEGFVDGDEVMFQEPSFSGSTNANLLPGSTAGVDSSTAVDGAASYRMDWQFIDNDPTRWVRLTTFNTGSPGPNPLIRFDQDSVVSLYVKVLPEPATAMMLLGGGLLLITRRRRRA